jgi:hypothetical protein
LGGSLIGLETFRDIDNFPIYRVQSNAVIGELETVLVRCWIEVILDSFLVVSSK